MPAVLAHPQDGDPTCDHDHERGDEERPRRPQVEEQAAADQPGAERDAAQHVLDRLRRAVAVLRQQVGIEAAVGRLVHVVREEEREHHQRRRPEAGHEREQREAEAHRAERDEHERAPAAERRVEGVAPGPDHDGERQREQALGREHERDQRRRVGEVAEERRQVRGGGGEREGEAEGAEAEDPDEAAALPWRMIRGSRIGVVIRGRGRDRGRRRRCRPPRAPPRRRPRRARPGASP